MKQSLLILFILFFPINVYAFGGGSTVGVEVIKDVEEETVYSTNSTINITINEQGVVILGTLDGKIHAFYVNDPSRYITPISVNSSVINLVVSNDILIVTTLDGSTSINSFVTNIVTPLINGTYNENLKEEVQGGSSSGSTVTSLPPPPQPAILNLIGEEVIEINYNDLFVDPGFIAYQGSPEDDISEDVVVESNLDTSKIGSYTIIYSVDTPSGEIIRERNINVVDSTKPILKLNGNQVVKLERGMIYVDPGILIDDFTKTNLLVEGVVDHNKSGIYKLKYRVTDEFDNIEVIERTVQVLNNISQNVHVDINNGFSYTDLVINSIYLDLDSTSIKYLITNSKDNPDINDSEWEPFSKEISINISNSGFYLKVLVMTIDDDYEIFTSNELPYEKTTSIKSEEVTIKVNGEETAEKDLTNLETKEVISKGLIKFQPNSDGSKLVVFDLRKNTEFTKMKVFYRINYSSSKLIISVNAENNWKEILVEEGEVQTLIVDDDKEIEFRTELTFKDETKTVEVAEFLISNVDGNFTLDLAEDSESSTFLYPIIGVISLLSLIGFILKRYKS
ncbi:DUF5011 domain-containing protein [Mycoplasmatota bacterium]|nr:DUF5011 domain-containing protein [Mycoplasmatota bacterium]